MLFVGQRVDDAQPRRRVGEGFEPCLREGADHGAVHPALEVAGDVVDRLAAAERDVLRRLDDVAAELADGDLEGRAGAQRRLLEQQRDVLAFERTDVAHAAPRARAFNSAASSRQASSCDASKSRIERKRVGVAKSTLSCAALVHLHPRASDCRRTRTPASTSDIPR